MCFGTLARVRALASTQLESIRIINGQPTPIVSFETHQLYCIRNSLTNKVEEGDEDDIRVHRARAEAMDMLPLVFPAPQMA